MKTYRDEDYRFIDKDGKEYISTPELDIFGYIQVIMFISVFVCGLIVTILNRSF